MAYSDVVLADSPYIYWPLQEASGVTTVADSSGNSRTGTVTGSLTQVAGPTTGTFSQLMDATGEYIEHGTAFPTTLFDYTVEGWLHVPAGTISTATAVMGLSQGVGGAPDGNVILNTDGSLNFYHRGHGEVSFNSGVLAKGYWHHIAVSVGATAGGTRMYVNGVQTNFWGTMQGLAGYGSMRPYIHTGNWQGGAAMRVAHVAYYQSSLSSAQILTHYQGMGTLANPATNTVTRTQVFNEYVDVAILNRPRIQVYNEYVDVAILPIPRVQVFNQYADIAIRRYIPGGVATTASVMTLTAPPGDAGPFFSVMVTAPTVGISLSAPQGLFSVTMAGPRGVMALSAGAGEVTAFSINRTGSGITLTLNQTTVQGLPNIIGGRITQGTPSTIAYIFLNNVQVADIVLDSSGGALFTIPLPSGTPAGTNTAKVSMSIDGSVPSSSATFTVTGTQVVDAVPAPYVPAVDTDVDHWIFRDYVDPSISYTFPINPEKYDMEQAEAPLTDMFTSSPAGKRIMFQGAAMPPIYSFSGRCLTEAHVRAMEAWSRKTQRIYLTDHFGRRMVVKVEGFTMQPVRDMARPWHHRYDMKVRVLQVEDVT